MLPLPIAGSPSYTRRRFSLALAYTHSLPHHVNAGVVRVDTRALASPVDTFVHASAPSGGGNLAGASLVERVVGRRRVHVGIRGEGDDDEVCVPG